MTLFKTESYILKICFKELRNHRICSDILKKLCTVSKEYTILLLTKKNHKHGSDISVSIFSSLLQKRKKLVTPLFTIKIAQDTNSSHYVVWCSNIKKFTNSLHQCGHSCQRLIDMRQHVSTYIGRNIKTFWFKVMHTFEAVLTFTLKINLKNFGV